MVVFVDLEDDAEPPELKIGLRWPTTSTTHTGTTATTGLEGAGDRLEDGGEVEGGKEGEIENLNRNGMTEAFGSYPYVILES